MMRERRIQMGLSLRDVQRATEEAGTPIPYATLSRVEQGKVDPGVRRMHALLRLYHLPIQLAADLIDIENFASPPPPPNVPLAELHRDGIEHWKEGRLQEGMSCFLAIRARQTTDDDSRDERHRALLSFSIAATNFGKIRLAHQIVENLLLECPDESLLVNVLTHGATCWHHLGAPEAALGFLSQAETHVDPEKTKQIAWIAQERARIQMTMGQDPSDALNVAEQAYSLANDPYGLCQLKGLRARRAFDQGDGKAALSHAIAGHGIAREYDYQRLRMLRSIDEGRALCMIGDSEEGLRVLQVALGEAIAEVDHVLAFHAHYAMWKAYTELGDSGRAALELSSAEYYARFVDDFAPEVVEVREANLGSKPTDH